jgi:serine protease
MLSLVAVILIVIFAYTIVEKPAVNMTPPVNESRHDQIMNPVSPGLPVYRGTVIVYFKEMPDSIDEFATTYGVTTIFVKADIKMAAFETDPVAIGGVVNEKTTQAIEKISKDSRVEQVERDTYMFVDRANEINTTPIVRYPEDYGGSDLVPDQVAVGFWRLPPSIEEFGAKYGGKPISLSETDMRLQAFVFETKDVKGFIDRASKDPYVSFVELNPYVSAA